MVAEAEQLPLTLPDATDIPGHRPSNHRSSNHRPDGTSAKCVDDLVQVNFGRYRYRDISRWRCTSENI
jgi:hypothetical protein